MSTTRNPPKYLLKHELMREIADAVCDSEIVYDRERTGMPKQDLLQVATALGLDVESEHTLTELYQLISGEIGMEPPQSAGNDWGLRRQHHLALYRRLIE